MEGVSGIGVGLPERKTAVAKRFHHNAGQRYVEARQVPRDVGRLCKQRGPEQDHGLNGQDGNWPPTRYPQGPPKPHAGRAEPIHCSTIAKVPREDDAPRYFTSPSGLRNRASSITALFLASAIRIVKRPLVRESVQRNGLFTPSISR